MVGKMLAHFPRNSFSVQRSRKIVAVHRVAKSAALQTT